MPGQARGSGGSHRLGQRRALGWGLCAAVLALAGWAFLGAGAFLVVSDPLRPARAVVVLAGQLPFRAMEAAALQRQGLAPEVWLTRNAPSDQELALSGLGIELPGEHTYSRQVLQKLGVAASAIRVLEPLTVNTADEVRAVARELDAVGGTRVIVVTSKYHTRRVRMLWRRLVGGRLEAVVRHARQDPFEPGRWWRSTPDALAVTRECFGLLNAVAGFPIRSRRP
jgi:uncharacterized SAM-binding protein YcdF (DUF218 family)